MSSVAKHKLNHFYRFFLHLISWFLHVCHSYLVLSRAGFLHIQSTLHLVPQSINHFPPLLEVPGGCPSAHLLLFLFILSGSRIFLPSVSRNAPWTSRLLLLFLLFPFILSFIVFSVWRTLLLYFPRCSNYFISWNHHFCSYSRRLLLSLFFVAPSFSLACQITSSNSPTLALLLSAILFLLYIQFISCCIWLISFSLQLNHGFVLFSSKPHTSSATLVRIFAIRSQLAMFSFFLSVLTCNPW